MSARVAWVGLLAALGWAAMTAPVAEAGRQSIRHPARVSVAALLKTAQAQQSEHDLAAARATLERAYELQPSAETLCALGSLALKDGRSVEAIDALRRCAASAAPVESSGGATLPASGELSVVGPRRALVFIDDHVVGTLPLLRPILLAPGNRRVELQLGGHRLGSQVEVLPGRAAQLNLVGKPTVTLTPAVALLPDFSRSVDGLGPRLREAATHAGQTQHLGILGQWGAVGENLDLLTCQDAPCQEKLAQRYRLRYVLAARVVAEPDGWQLWTQLFDAEVGAVASEQAASCDRCTGEQASARLGELMAQALLTGQRRPTGVLEVTSTPPGGDVLIGGLRLGQTPLRRTAFAGEHVIVVQRAGFAPYQNEVVVEPGRGAAVDAALRESTDTAAHAQPHPSVPGDASARAATVPAPATDQPPPASPPLRLAPPGRAPRPRWRVGLGISVALVGVALIGFGIAGLAADGLCTQTPVVGPNGELCTSGRVVDSRTAGVGLLSAGLISAGAGATLWAIPGARSREAHVAVGGPSASDIVPLASGSF